MPLTPHASSSRRWTVTTLLHALLLFAAEVARANTGLHAGDDLQRFVTRPDLMPPKWNISYHTADRARLAPGYIFTSPYRFADNNLHDVKWMPCEVGPMIFDQEGELVWSGACLFGNRISFDFGVGELEGERVLKGNLKYSDFPKPNCGAGWFLNSKYEMQHTMLLAEDVDKLNQHEFNVEDHGKRTMIITHDREQLNASDLGVEGKVWVRTDGFRELDTETSDVVFDWKTQDHVSLNESTFRNPKDEDEPDAGSYSRSGAWDAFHANSATKNSDGDYLVSIRHTDTLALVSGKDGHIIWRCGGLLSNFTFEQDAKFSRQHDARYLEHSADRSVISLMDNAIGDMQQDKQPATHDYSRGLILELSHKEGEPFVAKMLKQYKRPDGGYADRRGNIQRLSNGNVLMAWTDAGYISEHTDDDEVLMEAKWLEEWRFGTYRAFKYGGWVGRPETLPDVKALGYEVEGGGSSVAIYVSWNGATEVKRWRFSAGGKVLGTVDKTGFETVFATNDIHADAEILVEALDAKGKSLSRSEEVEIEWMTGNGDSSDEDVSSVWDSQPKVAVVVFALVPWRLCLDSASGGWYSGESRRRVGRRSLVGIRRFRLRSRRSDERNAETKTLCPRPTAQCTGVQCQPGDPDTDIRDISCLSDRFFGPEDAAVSVLQALTTDDPAPVQDEDSAREVLSSIVQQIAKLLRERRVPPCPYNSRQEALIAR